uniref:Secreted protein n=1 Tax=Oryza rufipogon TaxID=4529 RepID=A0A0E0PT97_ORYRU
MHCLLLLLASSVLICRPLPIDSGTSKRMLDADASQLPWGRVVVGRLGTPTASIGGAAASPVRAAPPTFNAAAAGAEEATTGCRHLRGDADARHRRPLPVRGCGGRAEEVGVSWLAERAWSALVDSAVAGPRVARPRMARTQPF